MGYLDTYGVAEARKERMRRRVILTLLAVFAVSGSLYLWFKNYRQEQRVREFLVLLERGDYPAAYAMWGCKVEAPCSSYDYKSFLEDWGENSPIGKVRSFKLGRSREQGSGVIVNVTINNAPKPVRLWVEKSTGILGFAPSLL
jgi:hypothetical protein